MSAGVCSACLGAAPVFTGAVGQRPEDCVMALHLVVHDHPRHLMFCHTCTVALVCAWARTARHTRVLPGAVGSATFHDGFSVCAVCGHNYLDIQGHDDCPGPFDGEEDDGPQSE